MRAVLPAVLCLAAPAFAQQVTDCAEPPDVTALVEPWEETSATLGAGAIRLALLQDGPDGDVSLLVLTLPPVEEPGPEETAEPEPAVPPPPFERRCRIVTEGGSGFAVLDIVGEIAEDPEARTLTARLSALRFIPESTELEEVTLVLTFGIADDSLAAAIETSAAESSVP
jgi:hypothetical protein